jgi:[ribosomal protein S5]-alanine N-acetyltransferase
MRGNSHVRFLGEGATATPLPYPTHTRAQPMAAFMIPTARLDLVLQTPDDVLAHVEALPPASRAEVSPDWLARLRVTAAGGPWALGFTAVERAGGVTVGGCAFKGPPDPDGVVEVSDAIDPAHRGRGYATEAARALAAFAFASGRVRRVRAHTKPDNRGSARVVEKCGFARVGEVIDPEDGLVCRWELGRVPAEPAAAPDPARDVGSESS